MFKKPKKRLILIRRILMLAVATFAVLIIVTASILFMLGYRLDSGNGRLEQGALLQFDSKPGGADIWIDGRATGSQTASKQTVLAGIHAITMKKAGYEDWTRTLNAEAGTLSWLDYVRLIPKNRPVEQVASLPTLAGLTFSPDLKWGLAIEDATVPTFQLIDLRSEEVKLSPLILPTNLFTTPKTTSSNFSMYKWNSGGRYIIIKHTYDKTQTEWLMVDTQDLAKSVNITRLLSVELSDLQFSGTSGTNLYALAADGVVRKIDLSAGTISRALISNVISFSVFEDASAISYVGTESTEDHKKVVGVYLDGENKPTVLRVAHDAGSSMAIALGRYFSDNYVAIADGDTVIIMTGNLPSDGSTDTTSLQTYGQLRMDGAVSNLKFSKKGAYIIMQSGNQLRSFEVEHKRVSDTTIGVAEGKIASNLKWLDNAHLWNDDGNGLVMRDFDGSNAYTIMMVESGFGATLSTNGKFIYGVGKTDDGYQLQRVRMLLN